MDDVLLIAGPGNPVIADLVAFIGRQDRRRIAVVSTADLCRRVEKVAEVHPTERFLKAGFQARCAGRRVTGVVLFLGRHATDPELDVLDALADLARSQAIDRVCIISTFRVHFGDALAVDAEARVLERFQSLSIQTIVFRPGPVLSPQSRASALLRALAFCHPLVPRRVTGCCVEGDELFAAVEQELNRPRPRRRATFTLLGPNRPWRDLLMRHQDGGILRRGLAIAAALLSWLLIGHALALLLDAGAKRWRRLRIWNFATLCPTSTAELLALYNPYNYRHVKAVGYNNGVVHFGQKHHGKTVVSTIACHAVARVRGDLAKFDAGATVRRGIDVLSAVGKEFYVVPNYSYVSLGTSFFIPIHGSASEYSTMGDTIEKALLYDPVADRFFVARRSDPAFQDYMYNLERPVLLLRLYLRVKDKSLYYLKQSQLDNATGEEVMGTFRDKQPSNVEIRKARAADKTIDIYKYYTQPSTSNGAAIPFPKDSLGRLWDRLEANPLSSVLFHALARHLIHHVELFFREDEFAVFWKTHTSLPILKLQLRYIKRDGLPHSPFVAHDCISVDLGMRRKHKQMFEAYLKETFRAVQFNPGKHSM